MVDCPIAAAKKALRYLARRVLQLEKEISELLEDLDQLTQQACPGLRKTYGIAVDGAATLLVAAGDNPARLRSDAAFAALCGVSPLQASSGKTNRHALNRGGYRQANVTLHHVVDVRLRWHEQTKPLQPGVWKKAEVNPRSCDALNVSLQGRYSTRC